MKKRIILSLVLLAMLVPCHRVFAQQISITLKPGWNWITYTMMERQSLTDAFGDFVPEEGDIIKSQEAHCTYHNEQWFGSLDTLRPSVGYMYLSQRSTPVTLAFGGVVLEAMVTTVDPTAVTAISATCGGYVDVVDPSVTVYIKGVCWGTASVPTFSDNYLEAGYGAGLFSVYLTNLNPNTTYYVRAFAVTEDGLYYGDVKSFTTRNGRPVVTTSPVSGIESTLAVGGGVVSDDGGAEVTERGICWSTNESPTLNDNHIAIGSGIGEFTATVSGLDENTSYHIRAYAINEKGTAYGMDREFTTLSGGGSGEVPTGAISGLFTINENGDQVYFSQGNLQYQASTNTWRFAEHQWDIVGGIDAGTIYGTVYENGEKCDNSRIASSYNGWIDLFGWATSGWNNGNNYYQPYNYETNYTPETGFGYGPTDGVTYLLDLTGEYANADWGVNNPISNGGNTPNQWRTLSYEEWVYVFRTRSTMSGKRFAKAIVENVSGYVLLPDNWDVSVYNFNFTDASAAPFSSNVITPADWAILETYGVVLIPTAGLMLSK